MLDSTTRPASSLAGGVRSKILRPWLLLVGYVAVSESGHPVLALPLAVATCLAAFVQMHDAIHESLGLSKRGHALVLTVSAQLLMKSGHALKATHLRHHGKCLGGDDPEGAPAHWPLGRVLFAGPFHILALRREALRIAPRLARRQVLETVATAFVVAMAVAAYFLWGSLTGLAYWAVAALVSAAMPLWASYIPHRLAPRAPAVRAAARVSRLWTPVLNSFAYTMSTTPIPGCPQRSCPRSAESSAITGRTCTPMCRLERPRRSARSTGFGFLR
jgi:beta-carotene hydroxylase